MDKSAPIVVGADHFGLPLKDVIRDYLLELGYRVVDMGVNETAPVDYPDSCVSSSCPWIGCVAPLRYNSRSCPRPWLPRC